MKILHYHPKVEAYVSTDSGYIDLSEDITSCSVSRRLDAPSEFTLRIQNPSHKYDMRISPMDRIVIFAAKGDARNQLLTGYVKSVDRFKLYDADMQLSGVDSLYRLQKLYFDPGLMSVVELFSHSMTFDSGWGGYEQDIYRWLVEIAGWPEDRIELEALPEHVVSWARDLYKKQMDDIAGAIMFSEELQKMLRTTGAVMTSGIVTDASGGTVTDGTLSVRQQQVISATESTGFQGSGWCAKWVSCVFDGILGYYPGGNANDMCDNWCHSSNRSDLKPGMIVACHPSGATGVQYGHVGVYIGNDIVRHNSTYVQDSTLDDWINTYGPAGKYGGGHVKWGWMEGVDLTR